MTRAEKIQALEYMQEKFVRMARTNLLYFTSYTMPNFAPAAFHRRYYNILDKFAKKEIRKLMVFMPPQHGKSEGSTRRLPAYILGLNPDTRIAMISYSASKARKFNRELQRVIDDDKYRQVFPKTNLSGKYAESSTSYVRTSDECEIVNYSGSFKTVGVGGPLTGDPVDVLIMDDIYKDAKSAWSETIRENVNDWYDSVAETRLHNDSQQLIVFTRWHEEDLAGRLIKEQGEYDAITNPNGWVIVTYRAIKEGAPTEFDPREEGEPLWPERHSLEKLQYVRQRNPYVFESLYQQDPKPHEGLMYERGFREYDVVRNALYTYKKNYTDTADEGSDYLCSICYDETDIGMYVTGVIFTQKPMEYTEVATAEMLTKHKTERAYIESNNGGRGFARAVEYQCRMMKNTKTAFHWFHQGENKNVRIFQAANEAQNLIFFPRGWDKMWPEFYNAVTGYMKEGKNAHDDAPDVLSGMVERFENKKRLDYGEPYDDDDIY